MILKVHIVFDYVAQFCEKYNSGLGLYSEQSLESSHYDYRPFWEKSYKLEMKHPKYVENMLKSEFTYNALHIQNMYLICLANIRFNIQIF